MSKFGAIVKANKGCLPVKVLGSEFLRPINYYEKLGSAQCKSSVMLAALKTPWVNKNKSKKSRNHTEILFKQLNIPIKIEEKKNFDFIQVRGLSNFSGFNYRIPGDISSCSFLVLTLLSKESKLIIEKVNINKTRMGIVKILNKMNAKIIFKNKRFYKGELISDIYVESCKNLKGINCPSKFNSSAIDEFLIIFIVAAKAKEYHIFIILVN